MLDHTSLQPEIKIPLIARLTILMQFHASCTVLHTFLFSFLHSVTLCIRLAGKVSNEHQTDNMYM